MVTKKYKKNQDNSPSGQSARLEQTITALHQERTKLKDFINEINRLENVLHYHDTKMMNVLGLQITCDAASLHYSKLQEMYDEVSKGKETTAILLHIKKADYDDYKESLVTKETAAPSEISLKESESVSIPD